VIVKALARSAVAVAAELVALLTWQGVEAGGHVARQREADARLVADQLVAVVPLIVVCPAERRRPGAPSGDDGRHPSI